MLGHCPHALRYQRGSDFFRCYFDDLAKAAKALKDLKGKVAILYVNLRSWVGDDAEALVQWSVDALKRYDGVKVYGLFHDSREAAYLVSKLRASLKTRKLYKKNTLVCSGFTPTLVHPSLKQLREECVVAHQNDHGLVEIVMQDGLAYPIIPEAASLKVPVIDELLNALKK